MQLTRETRELHGDGDDPGIPAESAGIPRGWKLNVAVLPRVWKKSYGIPRGIKVNFTAMILHG